MSDRKKANRWKEPIWYCDIKDESHLDTFTILVLLERRGFIRSELRERDGNDVRVWLPLDDSSSESSAGDRPFDSVEAVHEARKRNWEMGGDEGEDEK